jgi:hypothetical protein
LTPFVISTVYLVVSRWPNESFTGIADWVANGIATAVGVTLLNRLSLGKSTLLVLSIAYVPVMVVALVLFELGFVCAAFRACL